MTVATIDLPVQTRVSDTSPIWRTFNISGVELRNRLVASPISINFATTDGEVTQDILNFYRSLGEAGVGFVTVGATAVSAEGGSTANCMHIGSDSQNRGLSKLADEIRQSGAISSLQIFHVGAQGNTAYTGKAVVGPSPYVCRDIGIETVPLSISEIETIEDEFSEAVITGLGAGFDFVEIHVAHGYLLHQFMAPYFNKRTDKYGGNEENRFRIVRNIIDKVAMRDPSALRRLGARISGDDFLEDGLKLNDYLPLIKKFEGIKAAYWVVSAGIYDTASKKPEHMLNGDYWRYADQLKSITRLPVIAQGGVRTMAQADDIVSRGQGDLVGMAQALIADRNIIHKTRNQEMNAILPCTECRRCRYLGRKHLVFSCMQQDIPADSSSGRLDG
jgi:2,4-dienoyl-CoA reductase-like NADH-dependent reductase (Old Yellow Enzyme family)